MMREVKVTVAELELKAQLNETDTAAKVLEALPVASQVNLWGEEIYFSIPVSTGLEEAKEVVSLGDIAYWPEGKAMCIFFGMTPVSKGDEIRPISPVNVIGRIEGDPKVLRQVKQGDNITMERS